MIFPWKKGFLFAAITVFLGGSSTWGATPRTRQLNQERRIYQGIRSGELTARETRKLKKEERRIFRERRRAAADGVVTPRERNRINRHLDHASRNIYRQKQDSQSRP